MSDRQKLLVSAAAAGLLVAAPYVVPPYLISLLTLMMITAILAASVNLLAGEAGLVSIGHAGIAAAAGYGVAWAADNGLGTAAQLLVALAVTLVVSAVYSATTARTNGIVFLMITLALGMVIYGLALKWSTVTGGQNGLTGIARPSLIAEWWQFYFLVVAVFVAAVVAVKVFMRSPFGLTLRAMNNSELRAASLGYSVARSKALAVMLSGMLAGVAGVLAVWNTQFMSPATASFARSATSVVVVILGGIGSIFGPIVGSVIVIGTEHWLSSYVPRWPTLLGVLFIATVLFMPEGVTGALRRTHQHIVNK